MLETEWEFQLTCKAKVVLEVGFPYILSRHSSHTRPVCDSLASDSQSNHGFNFLELLHLGLMGDVLRHYMLVHVVGDVVSMVHGATTALDARPLGGVSTAEVVIGVSHALGWEV